MRPNSDKQLNNPAGSRWNPGDYLITDLDRFDLRTVFADVGLCELEIGVGKGTFLLHRARRRRDINLLGIEYATAYAAYVGDRLRRANIINARVISADANELVKQHLPDGCLSRIHIYFPDPWPKRKHNRRRLIQPDFVNHCWRVLIPGGQLLIVTDHRDYFEHMRRVLANVKGWATCDFPDLVDDAERIVGTNFEKKYAREGRPFFRAARLKYSAIQD